MNHPARSLFASIRIFLLVVGMTLPTLSFAGFFDFLGNDTESKEQESQENPPGPNDKQQQGVFQDWGVQCMQAPDGRLQRCTLSQTTVTTDTKQNLVTLTLGPLGEKGEWILNALLPLGFYIPGGVAMQIDNLPQIPLQLIQCVPQGCLASVLADGHLLEAMKTGKEARLGVMDVASRKTIVLPMSLKGFPMAMEKWRQLNKADKRQP
ncbi:MAG: invasion associated locus B family protein [Magnetococcales bacterium]|nr:invasion associated locus B family protein [Magnetococcales bacterium]